MNLSKIAWTCCVLSNKVIDENIGDQGDIGVDIESFTINEQNENESCIRNDHNDGIWINPTVRVVKRRVEHIPTKKRKCSCRKNLIKDIFRDSETQVL